MKMRLLSCFVIVIVVLGLNVSAMADFTIVDTFTTRTGTDLGSTEEPGSIYDWVETVYNSEQDVYIDETWGVLGCSGYHAACATIDHNQLNLDMFVQDVNISVEFSMVGTGEAIIEYLKGGNNYPFNEGCYFLSIHPSGVISFKRNDSGNIVDLARVEDLTFSTGWDTRDTLEIHITMTDPGVIQSVIYHNDTEIINIVDSTINARAFGTVALSSYGGWVTNVIYDNLEISATENNIPAFCGDFSHPYPVGDISGPDGVKDCYVDFFDFAEMGFHWLDCTDPNAPCSYNP